MQKLKTFLTVIGAVTILVLAANTAVYAATGGKFILGKVNKANTVSTLKRTTNGPALNLTTKSSASAPLSTNATGKVGNLNADRLDGYDSSALRPSSYVFTRVVGSANTSQTVDLGSLPAGTYQFGYSVYMQGGGIDNGYASCYFYRGRSGDYTYYGESRIMTRTSVTPGLSGTAIIEVRPTDDFAFYCVATQSWTTDPSQRMQVSATRTNVVGGGALRLAPSNARAIH
jgi:hypothetical protein